MRVHYTKHALEKFKLLEIYGFKIERLEIEEILGNPLRVDALGEFSGAIKPLDERYALRVIYRRSNDEIAVLTFYPVRRDRFHV